MALLGDHHDIGIGDLFNLICQRRLTGALVMASREEHCTFFFRHGDLMSAVSQEPGQLLGATLTKELDLDPQLVDEILAEGTTGFLGEELVRRNIVTVDAVHRVVERQIRWTLREILRWRSWAFHFESMPWDGPEPDVRFSTQLLIFDLVREQDEWDFVNQVFPELDIVLSRRHESMHLSTQLKWDSEFPPVSEILVDIDGVRTVRRLLQESPLPLRLHVEALARLVEASILEVHHSLDLDFGGRSRRDYVLPVLPDLFNRILTLRGLPDSEAYDGAVRLIFSDPVLTARALRLAGHRGYGKDSNLLGNLGLQDLKSLIFAEAVRGQFLSKRPNTWVRLWEQSQHTATACRLIAERVNYPDPTFARIAGLIHDLGTVSLFSHHGETYPAVYEHAIAENIDLIEIEERSYYTNHCTVGHDLAERWELPPELRTVIRDHHTPLRTHKEGSLVNIVRLANHVVNDTLSRSDVKRVCKDLGIHPGEVERLRLDTDLATTHDELQPAASTANAT